MAKKEELKSEFDALFLRATALGLSSTEIGDLESVRTVLPRKRSACSFLCYGLVLAVLVAGAAIALGAAGRFELRWLAKKMNYGQDERCFLENYEPLADMMRPVVDCRICENITTVDRVTKLSQEEFMEKYAFTGRPVVVTDGTKGWTASQHFSFNFFKNLYRADSPNIVGEGGEECQFFPYRTSFETLGDVFEMPKHMRDGVSGKPWYIGWSNCDTKVGNVLRKLYKKPYFLPEDMESSRTDWIFMGSPKYGANMHIDAVGKVSWQAQITGTKIWTLVPPPECWYNCPHQHEVLLNQGDILVVDTNKWFHSTLILNNTMSITIGSEFE